MRVGVAACAILLFTAVLGAETGVAGNCGGSVACQCGDAVTADYTMTRDLGPCPGHGLVIRSNVTLDCQGFRIVGRGDGSEQYGVYFNGNSGAEVTGARVARCDVSGFLRGIRLRSAERNTIVDNVLHHNGSESSHVGYGIDVASGAMQNRFLGNVIRDNADEGIHFGTGSGGNEAVDNQVFGNFREQIYLLASHGNRFVGNTSYGGGANSLYLKDSDDTYLERNTFRDRTARVTGDARNNTFVDNTFVNAMLQFRVYEASPNRLPTQNTVVGGSMTSTGTCLRFTSSSGNAVSDVRLAGCATEVVSEGTQAEPSSNAIVGVPLTTSRVLLDGTSTLSVGWWLDARVVDGSGNPVSGARVLATDALGAQVIDLVTGGSGALAKQVLWQYVREGSVTVPRTPHALAVTKDSLADTRALQAVGNLAVTVTLGDGAGGPPSGPPPGDGSPPDDDPGSPPGEDPEPPGGDPPTGGGFADAFDRADSGSPGNGWVEVRGDLVLSQGEMRNSATVNGYHVAVLPPVAESAYSVAADFASSDNNTTPRFGIVIGYQSADEYYVLYRLVGGTSVVRISRVTGGVEKVLVSAPIPNPARGAFFRLRADVSPSAVALDVDGVRRLSIPAPGIAGGRPGVLISVNQARAAHRVDNFGLSVP